MDDAKATQADRELADGKLKMTTAASAILQTASIETVSTDDDPLITPEDQAIFNARVVARVNGAPVFAGEVLERYGEILVQAREKLPPDKFEQMRDRIIQQNLRTHIERKVIVERLKSDLKSEQLKALDAHLDTQFGRELDRLKHQLNVQTKPELEFELNKRGTCLADVRESFGNNQMAMEYLALKMGKPKPVSRKELADYYESHLDEFRIPARIKWKQIQTSFLKGDDAAALAKIKTALGDLGDGKEFAEVARTYSDGVTAKEGGGWDWTQKGSLADEELEKILFELKPGELSPIIQGKKTFNIVMVTAHEKETLRPFEEVQQAIQLNIDNERRPDPRKVLNDLVAQAVIETDYDVGLEIAEKPGKAKLE